MTEEAFLRRALGVARATLFAFIAYLLSRFQVNVTYQPAVVFVVVLIAASFVRTMWLVDVMLFWLAVMFLTPPGAVAWVAGLAK